MPIEGCRIELCQDEYLSYATVDAITHRDINKPVTTSNWNLQTNLNTDFKNLLP